MFMFHLKIDRISNANIYGFVRFRRKEEATKAIVSFDGKALNSNSLRVCWAKFGRLNEVNIRNESHFQHRKQEFRSKVD